MSQFSTDLVEPPHSIDGDRYEFVRGKRVEKPPMGTRETWIAGWLAQILGPFCHQQGLGRVVPEMLYRLDPSTCLDRRPDLSFVSYERWPRREPVPTETPWNVVPDLAVEVISPSNSASQILVKINDYFRAGVRRVWVVYPLEGMVYVYESPTTISVLDLQAGDSLDGGDLFPGFSLPLATLFEADIAAD